MRLFVALPLDETMRDALCRAMEDLRAAGVRGRFSHRENLHLTLAFLGETPRLAQACRAVAGVEAPAFDLRLETFGLFRRQEGSILWAGLTPSAPLLALQRQVAGRLLKDEIDRRLVDGDPFDRQVLQRRLEGYTYKEIASQLDRRPKDVDNALQRIRHKIDGLFD